jgi:hypothetical protein
MYNILARGGEMNFPGIYIALSLVVLAAVAVLIFFVGKRRNANRLTSLAGLAFGFIVAGILFGENRFIGYGLMGVGVILAIADIVNRSKGS